MRLLLTTVIGLTLAGLISAQQAPQGPAPIFKVVVSAEKEKGEAFFGVIVTRSVPVAVTRVEIVNGQQVPRTVTEYRTVFEETIEAVNIAKSQVITRDGMQLPIDEVWRRLKKGSVVAVSGDANRPAVAYLKALSAETLIVIAPPSVGPKKGDPIPRPKADGAPQPKK